MLLHEWQRRPANIIHSKRIRDWKIDLEILSTQWMKTHLFTGRFSAWTKQCYSSIAWSLWIITSAFQTTNISWINQSANIALESIEKYTRKTFLQSFRKYLIFISSLWQSMWHRTEYHSSRRSCVYVLLIIPSSLNRLQQGLTGQFFLNWKFCIFHVFLR